MGDIGDHWRDVKKDYNEHVQEKSKERVDYAVAELQKRGYPVAAGPGTVSFYHKGNKILLHAYKGWFTGKGIKDGRGIRNLLKQLDADNE